MRGRWRAGGPTLVSARRRNARLSALGFGGGCGGLRRSFGCPLCTHSLALPCPSLWCPAAHRALRRWLPWHLDARREPPRDRLGLRRLDDLDVTLGTAAPAGRHEVGGGLLGLLGRQGRPLEAVGRPEALDDGCLRRPGRATRHWAGAFGGEGRRHVDHRYLPSPVFDDRHQAGTAERTSIILENNASADSRSWTIVSA